MRTTSHLQLGTSLRAEDAGISSRTSSISSGRRNRWSTFQPGSSPGPSHDVSVFDSRLVVGQSGVYVFAFSA